MTKYEWETELKKNIHRLPRPEQDKALAYYNELFADKAEAGFTETQIIAEFGNPCDVADKILAEYQFDVRPSEADAPPVKDKPAELPVREAAEDVATEAESAAAPQRTENESTTVKPTAKGGQNVVGSIVGGVFKLIFSIVGWVLAVAVWILFGAVMLAGGCLLGGGAVTVVTGFATYTANIPGMFAAVGVGLIAAGIGAILCLNGGLFFRSAKKICRALTGRKEKPRYKINRAAADGKKESVA